MSGSASIPPSPSEFAVKYGVAESQYNAVMSVAGRSGLTPTSKPQDRSLCQRDRRANFDHEVYQRLVLQSFTTWELEDIEALAYPGSRRRDAQANTITSNLHPLLQRSRWGTDGGIGIQANTGSYHFDVGNRFQGKWDAHNDQVWKSLEPILRLVSKFLDNLHHWPFFDAMLCGRYELLSKDEFDDGGDPDAVLYSLHPRPPEEVATSEQVLKSCLEYMATDTTLFIDSAVVNASGDPSATNMAWADEYTAQDTGDKAYRVYVAWQTLEPLLKFKLSPEERLAHEYMIAKTILHEVTHAFYLHMPVTKGDSEPFYEAEAMNELGRSMEKVLFGDVVDVFRSSFRRDPSPSLGI